MANETYSIQKDPKDLKPSSVQLTHVIYAMQAICFVFGVTYLLAIIALIINYVKLPDVQGTWLETHFRWQIRTFWFSLVWVIIGVLTIFIFIGVFILIADYLWVIYRVVKGWIYLNDRKPMSGETIFRF
jgi:uncharacterized membrane protein